jgi:hypothetical protein
MPSVNADDRRRHATARLIRLEDDDGSFDRAFWAAVPPEARLEALWDLTLDYVALSSRDGDQPRLQRSVCRVERSGR